LLPGAAGRGTKLPGFGWHAGLERIASCDKFNAEYEANMANFIPRHPQDLGVPAPPSSLPRPA